MKTHRLVWIGAALAASFPSAGLGAEPGLGFQVEFYEVELRPDLGSASISGRESIGIEATEPDLRQVAFSPNALTISEVAVNGMPVSVSSDATAIVVTLPRPLGKGEKATIDFTMRGTPARGVTVVPAGVYTGYFACDWMVCLQDSPGDKADLRLDLVLPRGKQSLGVGRLVSAHDLPEDLVVHRWRSDRPTSPYLFAFAAGAFPESAVETPHGALRYLDGSGETTDLPALFAQTPDMVAFLSERAGMDLPGGAYAQLLVPGREAQEAMGFSLIGKAVLELEREDPASAWIIAHELAHQWWGNLVTCATWQDFWLNEGFATFMVAAWEQHRFGEAAYQQELDVFRSRREQARERGYDKPLAWGGAYPSLATRRAVQYSKGALFLAELRETIGDAAFWQGVRGYTVAHAGKTVTSRDFQRAMEQASGRDLAPLFAEWVYGDGSE